MTVLLFIIGYLLVALTASILFGLVARRML